MTFQATANPALTGGITMVITSITHGRTEKSFFDVMYPIVLEVNT
jgi:hypothetical protein